MRLHRFSVSAAFLLPACTQVTEIEAFVACTERLETVIPNAKGLPEKDFSGDLEGVGSTGSDGNFKFIVPTTDRSMRWACNGNLKSRRIDEVSYDGVVKRPAHNEHWSY